MMMQALVGAGDNILVVDPMWPNGASAAQVMGEVRRISLEANSRALASRSRQAVLGGGRRRVSYS